MASVLEECQPFRLLDLPIELRLQIYKSIDFPTTWHVLDRTQALLKNRNWSVPPKGQIYDSRINLIRPHTPIEILMTCRLIYEEARPILQRATELCRVQPLRYLVDYSAAWALIYPPSGLRGCLGLSNEGFGSNTNGAVKDILQASRICLSRTRQTGHGLPGVRSIEMTIAYTPGVAYRIEGLETMAMLEWFTYYSPTRLVVVYKTPLPDIQLNQESPRSDSRGIEKLSTGNIRRERGNGDEAGRRCGVFVRPLEEEAFEKHVRDLEWYKMAH